MFTKSVFSVAILGVCLVACAQPENASTPSQPTPVAKPEPPAPSRPIGDLPAPVPAEVTVQIGQAQAGQTVEVAVGQRFAVSLVGTPTAGYVWDPIEMPAFLTRAGEAGGNTTTAQSQPGFTGGNHWEVFLFAPTARGEGDLTLVKRRPWQSSEPPVDTFTVRIVAR